MRCRKNEYIVTTVVECRYLVWFDNFATGGINHVAVTDSTDRALVKGHNVLRQGTRLVREDVSTLKKTSKNNYIFKKKETLKIFKNLHLTELFVECSGARFGWRLRPLIKHLLVPVDEERLR